MRTIDEVERNLQFVSTKIASMVKIGDNVDKIRDIILHHSFIAGGCITSLIRNEEVNDYDIYFDSEEHANVVIDYFSAMPNSILTPTSLTIPSRKYPLQFISRFHGDIIHITKNFDFLHTQAYFDVNTGKLTIDKDTLQCILFKRLIYTGSKFPILSMIRTKKFILREWHITAGEYIKIAYDISKLNLDDYNTLSDQFIGVDVSELMGILNYINLDYTQEQLWNAIDKAFEDRTSDNTSTPIRIDDNGTIKRHTH